MSSTLNHEAFSGACSFPERFALAKFEDGSVVLDLGTGAFYQLNLAGSRICAWLVEGKTVSEVECGLVDSFGLNPEEANRSVATLLARLEQDRPPEDQNPITFEAVSDGFVLRRQAKALLWIDPLGRRLRLEAAPLSEQSEGATYLDWVVPHLLVLRYQPVLHSSAVQDRDGVLAFSGPSGAGKTTTARAFVESGARLISEDLLLISIKSDLPVVYADAEANLRLWIAEKDSLWKASQRLEIDVGDLLDVITGREQPLREVLFLDRARRQGDQISAEPLGSSEAFALLLKNTFAELGTRTFWRELFEMNRELATQLRFARATVPSGLDLLPDAARRFYSVISTS